MTKKELSEKFGSRLEITPKYEIIIISDFILKKKFRNFLHPSEKEKIINAPETFKAFVFLKDDEMIDRNDDFDSAKITNKGIKHILQGGYTAQYRKERREKIIKIATMWATIFVPTIGLILTNWDKLLSLYNVVFK